MKRILNITVIALILVSMTAYCVVDNTTYGSSGGKFIKVGAAGGQFLKIGVGGRGNAMGGANGASVNDLTAIYWNPAGIAELRTPNATFAYTQWFAGFNHGFAAASMPLGSNFTLAAHFMRFGSKDIEITTFENPLGTGLYYSVADICGGLSIGGNLTDQFSFGATVKYVAHSFHTMSSSGVAFDLGTKYETGIQGIKLGFSIHNLGTEQTYDGQDLRTTKKLLDALDAAPVDVAYLAYPFNLPLTFRAGVSSEILKDETNSLLLEFDFVTMSDVAEQYSFGAEYTFENLISLRGGYLLGQDQLGLAGGIGLKYDGGSFEGMLDFSINPTKDFGLVNRLSININVR